MRILHTGDWHLGRVFHGVRMTECQAFVLDDFIALARSCRPDAIVIAGDIYDRAVPPPEAVRLFDEVLLRLADEVKAPVLAIAGNHDSPDRLGFASRLLSRGSTHLRGTLDGATQAIRLYDSHGPVDFFLVPFSEPATVRAQLQLHATPTQTEAMRALMEALPVDTNVRRVVVSHAFVAGGEESESERLLAVGGSEAVSPGVFSGINYVALGHLHKKQSFHNNSIHYAGSLLKYSFSEISHAKGVTLVEISPQGDVHLESISLRIRRDLRMIEGTLDTLVQSAPDCPYRNDYLLVRLTDRGALLDPMSRLRQAYPNVLHLERTAISDRTLLTEPLRDIRARNLSSLFEDFIRAVSGEGLCESEAREFQALMRDWQMAERETNEVQP